MNPEQPPAIEFRNVSISFDDMRALQNISFTLPRGEMLCITGDSDSGKSVLLRLALGFLRPDEGKIWINGKETTAMEEDDLLALRRETMGMVFQDNSFPDTRRVKARGAAMWSRSPVTSPAFRSACSKKGESLSSGVRRNSRKAHCPRFNICFTR
jgi:ABC-type polar amino acid transport system ATPase subunit